MWHALTGGEKHPLDIVAVSARVALRVLPQVQPIRANLKRQKGNGEGSREEEKN